MPRIRRYFPVSQYLNRDPEVVELRQRFGDWMLFIWLEILSWADRNEGEMKGSVDAIAATLAPISRMVYLGIAAKKIRNALQFMSNLGWIVIEKDRIRVVNYAKYHKSREPDKFPPNLPNLNKEKEKEKESTLSGTGKAPSDRSRSPAGAQRSWARRRPVALVVCPQCGMRCEGETAYFSHFDERHTAGAASGPSGATLTDLSVAARQTERDRRTVLAEQAARLLAEDAAAKIGATLPPRPPELGGSQVSENGNMRISQDELNKILDEANGKVRH